LQICWTQLQLLVRKLTVTDDTNDARERYLRVSMKRRHAYRHLYMRPRHRVNEVADIGKMQQQQEEEEEEEEEEEQQQQHALSSKQQQQTTKN
jgi:hypothetical protein